MPSKKPGIIKDHTVKTSFLWESASSGQEIYQLESPLFFLRNKYENQISFMSLFCYD